MFTVSLYKLIKKCLFCRNFKISIDKMQIWVYTVIVNSKGAADIKSVALCFFKYLNSIHNGVYDVLSFRGIVRPFVIFAGR